MSKLVVAEIENAAGANPYSISLGTATATTSGTTILFEDIPSGTKRIVMTVSDFSTNSTSAPLLQLGDAGGIEAAGYAGVTGHNSGIALSSTAGMAFASSIVAAGTFQLFFTISLVNASTFTWVGMGGSARTDSANGEWALCKKSLTAELTQVRLTTASADTFDAGTVNIQFQ